MNTLRNTGILWLTFLLCTVSCTGVLEETPNGKISQNFSFYAKTDLQGSVNILYRTARDAQFGITQYIFALMGDELTTHRASNKGGIRQWDIYNVSTNNDRLQWCWEDKYKVVKAANYIINGVEKCPDVSQADIDYALGQAHLWRAWAYFYLVRPFGPLPIIKSLEFDFSVKLSSVEEVYELIEADLLAAEQLLLDDYSGDPKKINGMNRVATKAGAQAMLSSVYLTMAGWPLEYGTPYYEKAAAYALKVINNPMYSLYDEYWLIHSYKENYTNKEMILGLYTSTVHGTGDGSPSMSVRGVINDIPDSGSGAWSDTHAEIGFYTKMLAAQGRNPRFEATYAPVLNCGGSNPNWIYYNWWDDRVPPDVRTPYFAKSGYPTITITKEEWDYKKTHGSQGNGWNDQTRIIIRLAEVYLWYAEATGRAGKTDQRAIDLLNTVRNRADGKGVTAQRPDGANIYPNSMSPTELAEAAYNEHGWEIAGGHWGAIAPRAADMHRMNRIEAHFKERAAQAEYEFEDPDNPGAFIRKREHFTVATGDTWKQSKMYVPYPAVDVERNPELGIPVENKLNMTFKSQVNN